MSPGSSCQHLPQLQSALSPGTQADWQGAHTMEPPLASPSPIPKASSLGALELATMKHSLHQGPTQPLAPRLCPAPTPTPSHWGAYPSLACSQGEQKCTPDFFKKKY